MNEEKNEYYYRWELEHLTYPDHYPPEDVDNPLPMRHEGDGKTSSILKAKLTATQDSPEGFSKNVRWKQLSNMGWRKEDKNNRLTLVVMPLKKLTRI